MIDSGYLEIAKALMLNILYDNGYIDINNSEKSVFSNKWQERIATVAGKFFDRYPHLLTDDVLHSICCGCDQDNEEYTKYEGYSELDSILNEYFNSGCGVGKLK